MKPVAFIVEQMYRRYCEVRLYLRQKIYAQKSLNGGRRAEREGGDRGRALRSAVARSGRAGGACPAPYPPRPCARCRRPRAGVLPHARGPPPPARCGARSRAAGHAQRARAPATHSRNRPGAPVVRRPGVGRPTPTPRAMARRASPARARRQRALPRRVTARVCPARPRDAPAGLGPRGPSPGRPGRPAPHRLPPGGRPVARAGPRLPRPRGRTAAAPAAPPPRGRRPGRPRWAPCPAARPRAAPHDTRRTRSRKARTAQGSRRHQREAQRR
nr:uncharacterized protein LOC113819754 [Penaeus vannamei]